MATSSAEHDDERSNYSGDFVPLTEGGRKALRRVISIKSVFAVLILGGILVFALLQ